MKGKVKWFNKSKGYGFILTEDESQEYFVHWKSIVTASNNEIKTLEPNEPVQFDLFITERGEQAINVLRLKPPIE